MPGDTGDCKKFKPERVRCEGCRTINLALQEKNPKLDLQIPSKDTCSPCTPPRESSIRPVCIKVMTPEEYKIKVCAHRLVQKKPPPCGHGNFLYLAKAGILVGTLYFTYSQGVWGDQQDVTECYNRWQEYVRSINTRRPPVYDKCGKVVTLAPPGEPCGMPVSKTSTDSIVAPAYMLYKSFVTSCFSGIVKLPLVLKCWYLDYCESMERRAAAAKKKRY